jgi:hypothetical protein
MAFGAMHDVDIGRVRHIGCRVLIPPTLILVRVVRLDRMIVRVPAARSNLLVVVERFQDGLVLEAIAAHVLNFGEFDGSAG